MRMRGKKPIISYRDTWSLDQYVFIPVIVESLKKFRSIENDFKGIPSTYLYRIYGDAWYDSNRSDTDDYARWCETIDFIIDSLEAPEPEYRGELDMICGEPDDKGNTPITITKSDETLWDEYKKEMEIWDRNRRRAIELFAVYFFDFWW